MLCRDEVALIEQRTALVNHLQHALHEYYPAILKVFDDWTQPYAWKFLEKFPVPEAAAKAHPGKHKEFFAKHRLDPVVKRGDRLEMLRQADQFQGAAPTIAAKSLLALSLVKELLVLQDQLDEYRDRITKLFERHPDKDLFGSLPGLGPKLGPRLLAELGDDRNRFESADGLRCFAGTAPVSYQSGKQRRVSLRRACNKPLRATVHLWSNLSRRQCVWADAYYKAKRKQGQSHACALRCLGQRWLNILWKMWQDRALYDEAKHTANQTKHGRWTLAMRPS